MKVFKKIGCFTCSITIGVLVTTSAQGASDVDQQKARFGDRQIIYKVRSCETKPHLEVPRKTRSLLVRGTVRCLRNTPSIAIRVDNNAYALKIDQDLWVLTAIRDQDRELIEIGTLSIKQLSKGTLEILNEVKLWLN